MLCGVLRGIIIEIGSISFFGCAAVLGRTKRHKEDRQTIEAFSSHLMFLSSA
jgi:hypothetical protein